MREEWRDKEPHEIETELLEEINKGDRIIVGLVLVMIGLAAMGGMLAKEKYRQKTIIDEQNQIIKRCNEMIKTGQIEIIEQKQEIKGLEKLADKAIAENTEKDIRYKECVERWAGCMNNYLAIFGI